MLARRIGARWFHHARFNLLKRQDFLLAAVGEGIAEVEVMASHVTIGDVISQFDPVVDVQTDKATVEITSRYDGKVVAIHYEIGDVAKVGTALITLETDEDTDSPIEAAISTVESVPVVPETSRANMFGSSSKAVASPAVRRIAKENNIDLTTIVGSGPGGRVLKHDVMSFISGGVAPAASQPSSPVPSKTYVPTPTVVGDTQQKISGLQKVMVDTMTRAARVPTLGLCEDIVMDDVVKLRGSLKAEAASLGVKLTYLPFLIKAASRALSDYPIINSYFEEGMDHVLIKGSHNIGLAMDTPRGLLVPNIKNVQDKSILEIAAELGRLQALGAESKLGKDDLSDGTFTLSNIGTIGGTYASPILFVPQVVIGALGRLQKLPRFDADGNVVAQTIMPLSWSADHRVIDGATIARFSDRYKQYLENPGLLLLHSK